IRLMVFVAVAVLISSLHERSARAQRAMQQAHSAALAASEAKDRFLAMISRELRNQLNPVLTTAALRERDRSLPESVRDDLAVVRRNVELEVRLIDDLVDLNRIRAGKLAIAKQQLAAHRAIHDVVQIWAGDIRGKNLKL